MNKQQSDRLSILATKSEINELRAVGVEISDSKASIVRVARSYAGQVKLKRTFTMGQYKFWRVMGPEGHPNYQSDLSLEGLKDWGIIV